MEAIDTSELLLKELTSKHPDPNIQPHHADIHQLGELGLPKAALLVCWGDTLTHLANQEEVARFLARALRQLAPKGHLLLGFRDYAHAL